MKRAICYLGISSLICFIVAIAGGGMRPPGGGGGVSVSTAGAINNFGVVRVTHKDGTATLYAPASSANADLGTALSTAVTAATAIGDCITIGPGTYELNANTLTLTANTSLIGTDRRNCTIRSSNTAGVTLKTNCTLAHLNMYGENRDSVPQPAIQYPVTTTASCSNFVIRDVGIKGDSDGILIGNGNVTGDIYDCDISTYWDCIALTPGATGTTLIRAWNCFLYSTARPNNPYDINRAATSSRGKLQLFNCVAQVDQAAGATQADAVSIDSGLGALEMYGGIASANTIGVATPHDLHGPIVYFGVTGSNSGALVVSGAVSGVGNLTNSGADGHGAATGTLTNAPAAGNPTKWIPINDGGTTRFIPAW